MSRIEFERLDKDKMEDVIIYLIASCVQMIVYLIYIREMLGLKRGIGLYVICWFAITGADDLFTHFATENSTIRNAILFLLCLEIIAFIVCKGSWKKKLFTVLAYDVFVIVIEAAIVNIITLLKNNNVDAIVSNKIMSSAILILTQMFAIVILFFVIGIWKKQKDYSISTLQWLGILIVSLGCFVSVCIITIETEKLTKGYIAICIILLLINSISYYFYIVLAQRNKMEFQTKLQMKQISMYEEWYEEIKNVRKENQSFIHDMNNHFAVLTDICNDGNDNPEKSIKKIKEYLNSLGMEYKGLRANIETGNMALDAVVGIKKSYAVSKGINLSAEVYIPTDMECNNMDIVIILGNLLDNAIEACEKLNDNKNIKLEMRYTANNLFISIENTYNGVIEKKKDNGEQSDLPKTTKGDFLNHGIGLQNVKNIVNKYNGDITWSVRENVFRVEILIYQFEKIIKKDEFLQKSDEFLQSRL